MGNFPWTRLADEALLQWRVKELGLTLEGTELAERVAQLYRELAARGLRFHPPCYLGDEWCVYEGIPAIALPFYLVHPRLCRLEATMVLEVEGGSKRECMQLLRHETGHALMYAYGLNRRRQWRELFGPSHTPYAATYRPRPYSKSFVIHLPNWYAQAHPDEDFAETFAVWLTPHLNWRRRYRQGRARDKLTYVAALMQELMVRPLPPPPAARPGAVETLQRRLATHYARKRKAYAQDFPDFYDTDLHQLFPTSDPPGRGEAAEYFLHRQQRAILHAVAQWTGCRKYAIRELLRALATRCRTLGLQVHQDEATATLHVVSCVTAFMMNYLHTGKFKRMS